MKQEFDHEVMATVLTLCDERKSEMAALADDLEAWAQRPRDAARAQDAESASEIAIWIAVHYSATTLITPQPEHPGTALGLAALDAYAIVLNIAMQRNRSRDNIPAWAALSTMRAEGARHILQRCEGLSNTKQFRDVATGLIPPMPARIAYGACVAWFAQRAGDTAPADTAQSFWACETSGGALATRTALKASMDLIAAQTPSLCGIIAEACKIGDNEPPNNPAEASLTGIVSAHVRRLERESKTDPRSAVTIATDAAAWLLPIAVNAFAPTEALSQDAIARIRASVELILLGEATDRIMDCSKHDPSFYGDWYKAREDARAFIKKLAFAGQEPSM